MSWRRKSCRHNKRQPAVKALLLRDLIYSNGEKGNESFALDLKRGGVGRREEKEESSLSISFLIAIPIN